ncbi:MAG TPA: hypothetical protein VM008_19310 [Phycisphaerae bacterium]|nr:hypothetical protein [Phycisphaerae bacterium]
MESVSGHIAMYAPQIDEYVKNYGTQGWLMGFSDQRQIGSLVVPRTQDLSKSISEGHQQDQFRNLRVKDLFYIHYTSLYGADGTPLKVMTSSYADRDAAISTIVDKIRKKP